MKAVVVCKDANGKTIVVKEVIVEFEIKDFSS